ncbi:hypothetical protein ACSZNN_13020 [Aeromonas hydrophila]
MNTENSVRSSLSTPIGFLQLAIRQVPAVRFAIGVGGIAAVVAIVLIGWKLEPQTAIFGTLVVLIFMVVLVAFAALSKAGSPVLRPLAMFLAWAFLSLAVAVAILFVSCAFFDTPKTLPCLLQSECGSPDPSASDRYTYPGGSFERKEKRWIERKSNRPNEYAIFDEVNRDREYIYLIDRSRHSGDDESNVMNLRLPVSGGMAQWSWQNPIVWVDLYVMSPQ